MSIRVLTAVSAIGAAILLTPTAIANAAEIRVLSTNAMRPVLSDLSGPFERATAHALIISFTESPALVMRQIVAGETFDVGISISGVIDDLIKEGKGIAATRVDFARTGIGVGVRAGTPKPDVSSTEAFKLALLNARSVAYATEGRSGTHFLGLLGRLGIAEELKPKLRAMTGPTSVAAVAKGEGEIAVVLIPSILAAAGVELAGPIPSDVQLYLGFAAAVVASSKQPEAADALLRFLIGPTAAPVIKAKGMEPIAPR